ncbi:MULTISPECIES: AtuA-related protein [Cupriavidus]|uniref:AtuA-related protein n=1 Tax=Cupriavidus taiwanensis TaxID=164546 RepID=UPI0015743CD5|nr:hypothetical protein [Cupriavidus taiwanensis]NSX16812.1 hypothetical protein [Cupriavidus taiwanensis]
MIVSLRRVAHTRSGDKGNTSNTAVIAYDPAFYPYLKAQLTAAAFKALYGGVITGEVERHAVDGLQVLNFVAHGALGGGVSRSLALDNYGKALASVVLRFELDIPDALAGLLRGPPA